ncbi:hypothetical protein [Streptomyces sp. NBC_01340]|uniref:hypothetical protein n=1 Tax=Streptomyces sp. NBC_01340 TaxID=2903830 RepID=UPI003DA3136B
MTPLLLLLKTAARSSPLGSAVPAPSANVSLLRDIDSLKASRNRASTAVARV